MYSFALWNGSDDFQIISHLSSQKILHMGITEKFLLSALTDNKILYCLFPLKDVPVSWEIREPVVEICTNFSLALILTTHSVWLIGEDLFKSGLFSSESVFSSNVLVKLQGLPDKPLKSASLSSHHAAVVCEDGNLYTWGTGLNGELGVKNLKSSQVCLVDHSKLFKVNQVACGKDFTAVVTQGGLLYIYGKTKTCNFKGISAYPYTVPELEEYFVLKIQGSRFGVIVLTDSLKCFVTKGCFCTVFLLADKPISSFAVYSKGICGFAKDKSKLFVWEKKKDWKSVAFKFLRNNVLAVFNSAGPWVGIHGYEFSNFPGEADNEGVGKEKLAQFEPERKTFEQLLGAYNIKSIPTHNSVLKDDGCKIVSQVIVRYLAQCFNKIKSYSFMHLVYKKACRYTFLANALEKSCKRAFGLDRRYGFSRICDYQGWGLLETSNELVLLKTLFCLVRGDKGKITEIMLQKFKKSRNKTNCDGYLKRNPLELILLLLESHDFNLQKYIFNKWKKTINPPVSALKKHLKLFSKYITKFLPSQLKPLSKATKAGILILRSIISSLLTSQKSKVLAFLRSQVLSSRKIKSFIRILKFHLHLIYSSSVKRLKSFKKSAKNLSSLKLVTLLKVFQIKIDFFKISKALNSLKNNSFSKHRHSDPSMTHSPQFKSFYKFSVIPPHGSPSPEQTDLTHRNTEKYLSESSLLSLSRRDSMHSFSSQLLKKVAEKVSSYSKSGIITKSKITSKKKNDSKLDKRIAYTEGLKERQRKSFSVKMPSDYLIKKNNFSLSCFEGKSMLVSSKKIKYESAASELARVLSNTLCKRKRLPFNILKFTITGKVEEVHKKVLQQKKYMFINIEKNRKAELKIKTHLSNDEILQPPHRCFSPIESPISKNQDEIMSVPQTPFTEILSPKSQAEFAKNSWKVKLLALGFNKFSRIIKMIAVKLILA